MTKTIRTRFTADADNRCSMTYENEIGEVVTRDFWAPVSGGYVREESGANHGTLGQQVCERLNHRGATLEWSGTGQLVDLIRREYREMRRAERKFWP